MRALIHTSLVVFLTLLTQIGGIAYLLTLCVARRLPRRFVAAPILFVLCYVSLSLASVVFAPLFGRVPLPCLKPHVSGLAPVTPLYCILNRHYVRPQVRDIAIGLASHMDQKFPGTVTMTLDGNFPYMDGFPLLPHLSHNDGRKLDLAFHYRAADGAYQAGRTRSPIGYFAFETPAPDSANLCQDQRSWASLRWDLPWLQPFWRPYKLDQARTRAAIRWLATTGRWKGVSKIFIEPHLARLLKTRGEIIRFQGCAAARHDDHIHFQVVR